MKLLGFSDETIRKVENFMFEKDEKIQVVSRGL